MNKIGGGGAPRSAANEAGRVMQLGALFSALIEQSGKSKNAIIKEMQIDRSSFYKILSGERRTTDYQLVSYVRILRPRAEELRQILDAFEQEQAGESLYAQREEVRRFINGLSDAPQEVTSIEALQQFVQREMQEEVRRYRAFLPVGSACLSELFSLLRGSQNGDEAPEIYALIANEENGDVDILHELGNWFSYISCQTMRFHAYTLWETTRGLEALPFPYYIIGDQSILMISGDGTRFLETRDPNVVAAYRENYDRQIAQAEEIASTEMDYESILRFFTELWAGALDSREEVYLLSPRPCLYLCSTDDLVRKYMHDESCVQYSRMIRGLNMREFTTRSGMQRFVDELTLCEAGFRTPIDPVDMDLARSRILGHKDLIIFFLDEERIHLPQDWQIFVVAHRMVVFVPYATSSYMLRITSSAVVEPLTEWCESRRKTFNNDIPLLTY